MAYSFLFPFSFFSLILDHTEKLSNQSSTQEARVWLVRSQSTLLSEQSEEVRLFPLQFPYSMAFLHRARDIIRYWPIRSSSVVREFNNLPVMLSQSIRDVMIRPYGLNRFSRSCCVMFFGKPLTYKFAPLIASLLGLAYDTCVQGIIMVNWDR